ncbi:MAG: hypothetical protein ACI4IG_04180 [Eubacterium sp.]
MIYVTYENIETFVSNKDKALSIGDAITYELSEIGIADRAAVFIVTNNVTFDNSFYKNAERVYITEHLTSKYTNDLKDSKQLVFATP